MKIIYFIEFIVLISFYLFIDSFCFISTQNNWENNDKDTLYGKVIAYYRETNLGT